MNIKTYILIFTLLINYIAYSSDWKQSDNVDNGIVKSINCLDSDHCYALVQFSLYTRLYKSTNQGENWEVLYQSDPFKEISPYLINAETGVSPHPDYYFMAMYDS